MKFFTVRILIIKLLCVATTTDLRRHICPLLLAVHIKLRDLYSTLSDLTILKMINSSLSRTKSLTLSTSVNLEIISIIIANPGNCYIIKWIRLLPFLFYLYFSFCYVCTTIIIITLLSALFFSLNKNFKRPSNLHL